MDAVLKSWPGLLRQRTATEYDYIVKPGADPSQINVTLEGVSALEIQADGSLAMSLSNGDTLIQEAPVIYQEKCSGEKKTDHTGEQSGDVTERELVKGRYRLASATQIGFTVENYDKSRELVIDPVLAYSSYLGGSMADSGSDIAVAPDGSIYLVGTTYSSDFPAAGGGAQNADAFVSKLTSDGVLQWSVLLGGSNYDWGQGVTIDSSNDIWWTGYTYSTNFPMALAYQSTFGGGNSDAFVTKLRSDGRLLVSTYLGGSDDDVGYGIGIDSSDAPWVTGDTSSSDFPVLNAHQASHAGGTKDVFVTKFNSGGVLQISTYLGGSDSESGNGIAIDGTGAAWLTGTTRSSNFPLQNAWQASLGGGRDAFVTRFDNSGVLLSSTYLGGSSTDGGQGVSVDSNDALWITGTTKSNNFPVQNAPQAGYGGGVWDAFLTNYSLLPAAAMLVSPSGSASSTPTYSWNAVADATYYRLYVADGSGVAIQTWYTAASAGCSSGTGTCSITPSTAVSGSVTWWVMTWNSAGNGPWSTSLSFTVGSSAPIAATLIAPSGSSSTTAPAYSWYAVSNATYYYLYVADATGVPIKTWYTASAAGCSSGTGTCSVTPATAVSGSVTWWVRTWNNVGNGPWSSSLNFSSSGAPGAATLVSPSGGGAGNTPTYTWNAESVASYYQLYVSDATGNPIKTWYTAAQAGCSGGSGTCQITPSTAVTGSVLWWIRTWNSTGIGPWSSSLSFTP